MTLDPGGKADGYSVETEASASPEGRGSGLEMAVATGPNRLPALVIKILKERGKQTSDEARSLVPRGQRATYADL